MLSIPQEANKKGFREWKSCAEVRKGSKREQQRRIRKFLNNARQAGEACTTATSAPIGVYVIYHDESDEPRKTGAACFDTTSASGAAHNTKDLVTMTSVSVEDKEAGL